MEFEFEKSGEVESLDRVPQEFRGFYAAGDGGKFKLTEIGVAAGKAVDGLNKSLKAARRDADEAKKSRPDLAPFRAIGQLVGIEDEAEATNPETLKAAVERLISESKDGKVNWEKMKKSLEQGFQQQLQAKDGELQTMGKTLQKYLVTTAAVQAIASNKGVPELLLPHIQAKTKVIKEGDEYVVRVVDEAGDPRGNASGGFMTVEDLVKEMKASPTFGRAFESEAPNGTGTQQRHTMQRPQQKQGELSSTQKIAAGLDKRSR